MDKTRSTLLCVHHGALGDVVTAFWALMRLRPRFALIDILCQNELSKLAVALKVADHGFALESAAFAPLYADADQPAVNRLLRTYDTIVLLSDIPPLQAAFQRIVGQRVVSIPPRPEPERRLHVTAHLIAGFVRHGLLPQSAQDRPSPENYPDLRDPDHDPDRVLIHPGSGSRRKNWPPANFAALAAALSVNGLRPEFILGPAEDLPDALLADPAATARPVWRLDRLEDLVKHLKAAAGFVGNDSGASHLAAFLGLPTVAIFGPSDPERWKPLGRRVEVLWAKADCRPCFETGPEDCNSRECLERIRPPSVADALYRLLASC